MCGGGGGTWKEEQSLLRLLPAVCVFVCAVSSVSMEDSAMCHALVAPRKPVYLFRVLKVCIRAYNECVCVSSRWRVCNVREGPLGLST